jgi:hypothetical protein
VLHDLRLHRARLLRGLAFLRRNGVAGFLRRQALSITSEPPVAWRAYRDWLAREPRASRSSVAPLPRTSLLVPVFRPARGELEALYESLRAQSHADFELCLATDGLAERDVARSLERLAARDARVRLAPPAARGGISAATNRAAAVATGAVVALLDQDDLLPPDALLVVADAFAGDPELDLVYTDEDQLESWGLRDAPRFKPGPSPTLLLGVNYVMHLLALRRSLFDALGGLRSAFDGAQDHDLALRGLERARRARHLRRVAYTWRRSRASVAGGAAAKPWAYEAGRRAVEDAARRRGLPLAAVRPTPVAGVYALEPAPRRDALACHVVFARGADAPRWNASFAAVRDELRVLASHDGRWPEADALAQGALLVVAQDLAPDAEALRAAARLAAWPGIGALSFAARGRGPAPVHLGYSVDRAGRAEAVPHGGLAALCPHEVATSCGGLLLFGPAVACRAVAFAGALLRDEDVACLGLASFMGERSTLFVPRPVLVAASPAPPRALDLTLSPLWPAVAAGLPDSFFEDGADRFCPRHPLLAAAGHPAPAR